MLGGFRKPDGGFVYGGVLTSNGDAGTAGIPNPHRPGVKLGKNVRNYIGNNHGSVIQVLGQYYVFGHRQTNRSMYCRQGYAEKIRFENGRFRYAELTSCGLNEGPLRGEGTYDAGIACHLMSAEGCLVYGSMTQQAALHPAFTQEGEDREDCPDQYISNMRDGSKALYRYFTFRDHRPCMLSVKIRGAAEGILAVTAGEDPTEIYARIPVSVSDMQTWTDQEAAFTCPEHADTLCFCYTGHGSLDFRSFTFLP